MGKLTFFVKRLAGMDYRRFASTFSEIRKTTGKSAPGLAMDLLVCGLVYNAGYMDYKIARMDRLNAAQRQIGRAHV